ncbi:MAG: hypothetical protein ABI091_30020 [Ferruginibacter sp.]
MKRASRKKKELVKKKKFCPYSLLISTPFFKDGWVASVNLTVDNPLIN